MQKTVPPLFIAFFNLYGFLWPPPKISGCVSLAPITHFFHKGPPFEEINFKLIQRGNPYEKKCAFWAKETHPDILRGGHRNPYQMENVIKSGGTVFGIYHLR